MIALRARGTVKKSIQMKRLFVPFLSEISSETECFMTKNSDLASSSSPRILFHTNQASVVRPLCIRNRGDSGMNMIPTNMTVEKTSEDPSMYLQLPDSTFTKMAATT